MLSSQGFPLVRWCYLYLSVLFSFLAVDDLLLLSNFFSVFFSLFPPVSDFLSLYQLPFLISHFLNWLWLSSFWATPAPFKSPFSIALFNFELPFFSNSADVASFPSMSDSFFKVLFPCLAKMLFFYLPPPFLFLVFLFSFLQLLLFQLSLALFLLCPCLVFVCSWQMPF